MKKTVMVVDDDQSICKALYLLLKPDFNVLTAETGSKARKLLDDHEPDLILLDIGLPDVDGVELLQEIRSGHPNVMVVMITAVNHVKTVVKTVRLGAYDYLVNPIDAEEVTLTLKNALETMRLDIGRFPSDEEGLGLLWQAPRDEKIRNFWKGPYLDEEVPLDPWNTPYRYALQSGTQQPFALYSLGADSKPGGEDANADIGYVPQTR